MISHFWPSPARANPPWSNDILTSQWDQILAAGGPDWMPKHTKARTRIKAEEFGTGSYGVVMPTMTPGIVMKLTSDADEAAFVSWVVNHPQFAKDHPGLIPYYKIVPLYDTAYRRDVNPPLKRSGRDVFVLWRAEAEKVGETIHYPTRGMYGPDVTEDQRNTGVANQRLGFFRELASKVRIAFKSKDAAYRDRVFRLMEMKRGDLDIDRIEASHLPVIHETGIGRIAALLEACRLTAELMSSESGATDVGSVLRDLIEDEGILLADVHTGNIGEYTPADRNYAGMSIPVITDPGHAVFLK